MKQRIDPEREEVRAGRARYFEALAMGYTVEDATAYANEGVDSDADITPPEDRRPKPTAKPASEAVEGEEAEAHPNDAVEIPANWQDLPWPSRLKLAASVADGPVSTGEDVTAAIEAELARRAGA